MAVRSHATKCWAVFEQRWNVVQTTEVVQGDGRLVALTLVTSWKGTGLDTGGYW